MLSLKNHDMKFHPVIFFMAGFSVVFRAKKWPCVQPAEGKGTQRHHKKNNIISFPKFWSGHLAILDCDFLLNVQNPWHFQYTAWVTRDPYFMVYQLNNPYITGYTWSSLTTQRTTGEMITILPLIYLEPGSSPTSKFGCRRWHFQNMVVQGVKKYETNTKNGTICIENFPRNDRESCIKTLHQRFKKKGPT